METHQKLGVILLFGLLIFGEAKKSIDPYKVLGVERNASQREIQKAFHKLSLQYHPDKNKNKGAQDKFEEINNAYEILSDEQKRKNYDLYGDVQGGPSFDAGNAGDHGGYSYYTSGGSGQSGFRFSPDDWQNMGGQGGSKSFSFSFGGPSGGNSFGFGLDDIFSKFFGGSGEGGANSGGFGGSFGSNFGGFGSSGGFQSGTKSSPKNIQAVNSKVFEEEINDRGVTWLLLTYTLSMQYQQYESILEGAASSLKGALKVGKMNCEKEQSFCNKHSIYARRSPRLFVYSYIRSESGSLVEYNGEWDVRSLKSFCQEHLPRFSRRVNLDKFEPSPYEKLPQVILLSTKKDTPVIWRALSGLHRRRFVFYDAQVHDVNDPKVKKLGVDALPAIVGWLSNGEKRILKTGISVKDLESAVQDLCLLLEGFEKKNKKATSSQARKPKAESSDKVPVLSASNFDSICGDATPVCVIGAFRSSKSKGMLESLLSMVSQKSLSRHSSPSSKDSVSYALLDATKHQSFLSAFEKSGFKSSEKFLLAYKPRRRKYAAFTGELTAEEVETFVGSVLSGDVHFERTRQSPVIR